MRSEGLLIQSRVLIVAGKGGVGKTTVSAALCMAAAKAGLDALLVELESEGPAAKLLGWRGSLSYDDAEILGWDVKGRLRARCLRPENVLADYLYSHGLAKIAKRLASSGTLDVVSTAIPGLKDILVLGKIRQLEEAKAADLLVVDAPASGHALSFLNSASGLADAAASGPLRTQSLEVLDLLHDEERSRVLLVTIAEETPVNETVETAFALEDRVGVALGPLLVNAVDVGLRPNLEEEPQAILERFPDSLSEPEARALARAAHWRRARYQSQQEALQRLSEALPLQQIILPLVFDNLETIHPDHPLVVALSKEIATEQQ